MLSFVHFYRQGIFGTLLVMLYSNHVVLNCQINCKIPFYLNSRIIIAKNSISIISPVKFYPSLVVFSCKRWNNYGKQHYIIAFVHRYGT